MAFYLAKELCTPEGAREDLIDRHRARQRLQSPKVVPPACRRAACRTLSWHDSRSCAWQVALTEPEIAHNKQHNDDNTDDREDTHTTLLVLLGTRQLCAHPGSSRPPGSGLACGALVPRFIETPCNACISTSVAQVSRAICDILATNVGILRKSGSQKQTADNVRLPRI